MYVLLLTLQSLELTVLLMNTTPDTTFISSPQRNVKQQQILKLSVFNMGVK